jgi:hypothetical protein
MKSLIKLTIFALLIATVSESYGQTFGVKAGVNFSNMLIKKSEFFTPYDANVPDPKMKTGFHIGAVVEYPVFNLFSIESGLSLSTLGAKLTHETTIGGSTLVTKAKHCLYYLSIPLSAKVPFSIKGFDFYGSVGGYAGLGLIGNADTVSTYNDTKETIKGKIAWGSEQGVDYLKRLDYGLTFGAGMKLNSLQFGLSYNLGMANISTDSEIGSIAKNRVLAISVTYMFGAGNKPEPVKPKADVASENKAKQPRVTMENKPVTTEKSGKEPKVRAGGKKAAALEAERLRLEKIRTDSLETVRVEQERLRIEKAKADSIEAARVAAAKIEAEKLRLAKFRADSIETAKNTVIYRVQFASNAAKKGSYNMTIGGKNYSTWEYNYSGAYRSTVGEFKTFAAAMAFQKTVRQSGYPQAFVVAFKNNIRTTDPALFK